MSNNAIFEAFKDLSLLNEDTFDYNKEGVEELKKFMDGDISDDLQKITDSEAESREDLKDNYLGNAILSCDVCHEYMFKRPEDIVIDEETQLANVGEECPMCHTADGFKIIGQVAEFKIDDDSKEETENAEITDDAVEVNESLTESDKPAATSIEDAQKWVDYDMKHLGKISERTNKLVRKAGFQIIKDEYGDYEVTAGDYKESLEESFEKVDIETDKEKMSMTAEEDGKVTVVTEPKENSEVIVPVSNEVKAEIEDNSEDEDDTEEVEFDEFDEESFDELGEGYLKETYENVKSYKTYNSFIDGNKLVLEGLITFNSGKKSKTRFIFESHIKTKSGKLKFIGENAQISSNKKAFTLLGSNDNHKLITESLTYNYRAKDNDGKSNRIYGTMRVSK